MKTLGLRTVVSTALLPLLAVALGLAAGGDGNADNEAAAATLETPSKVGDGELLDTLAPGRRLRESTLAHDEGHLAATGKAIVIAKGRAPGGPRFELVAYAAKVPRGMRDSLGGAKIATCIDTDFPSLGQAPGAYRTCFGGDNDAVLHISGLSEIRGLAPQARYAISGETAKRVANVAVSFKDADGERVSASGSYGRITGKVARMTGIRFKAGQLIAFLPADAIPPSGQAPPTDALVGSLKVTAFGGRGQALDTDTWGDS